MPAIIADDDGDGCRRATGGKPVAPADDKAGIVTQRAPRKIVLPAAARNRGAKFGHRRSTAKRVEPAENPNGQKQPRRRQSLCDLPGRVDDARSDRISNGRRHPKPHAKHFQQPAAAVRLSGRRQRCGRQLSPLEIRISGTNKAVMITPSEEFASVTIPIRTERQVHNRGHNSCPFALDRNSVPLCKVSFTAAFQRNSTCPMQ